MPRPRSEPRVWEDKKRGTIHILDGGWKSPVVGKCDGEGRRAAIKALARYVEKRESEPGSQPEIPPDPGTFAAILPSYLEHLIDEKRAAIATVEYEVRNLLPFWHDRRPHEVTIAAVKDYRKERVVPRQDSLGRPIVASDTTVAKEIRTLQAAANLWGKDNGGIQFKYYRPAESPPRETWLRRDEAARLLRAARHISHLRRFILIALYAGRRRQAVLDLPWNQVDLESGMIDFRKKGVRETKKRRGRTVAPQSFLAHLRRWKRMDDATGAKRVIHIKGSPVISMRTSFLSAVKRAGLEGVDTRTLKHTAVTWAAIRKVDIRDASIYFATTIDTLESVYLEHAPDILERVARDLGRRR